MKNIVFITNSIFTFGGEQRVVCIIANELCKYYNVTIFTTDNPLSKENPYNLSSAISVKYFRPFKANVFIKGIRFFLRFPLFKQFKNLSFIQKLIFYNKKMANNLNKTLNYGNDYDLIIAVSGELTMLLGLAQQNGLKTKTIGWEHNSFEAYFRTRNLLFYKMDKLWLYCTKYINKFILLNEDYVEKYKKAFGCNCTYIYNPRSFVSNKKSTCKNKDFIVCCRFVKGKGIDLLLKSFALFCKKNTDWQLKIVGDGPLKQEYIKYINKNHIENRVIFLGKRYDINQLLIDSSIYVLPSRWEGFPMSLTEAYEVGIPAIFFDIPATIPFRKNNEGICCKSYNVQEYADAMLKLASDESLRIKMGKNAIKFAESISIENIILQWQKEINELLN